jgi:hypothetical protein
MQFNKNQAFIFLFYSLDHKLTMIRTEQIIGLKGLCRRLYFFSYSQVRVNHKIQEIQNPRDQPHTERQRGTSNISTHSKFRTRVSTVLPPLPNNRSHIIPSRLTRSILHPPQQDFSQLTSHSPPSSRPSSRSCPTHLPRRVPPRHARHPESRKASKTARPDIPNTTSPPPPTKKKQKKNKTGAGRKTSADILCRDERRSHTGGEEGGWLRATGGSVIGRVGDVR